MFMNSLNKTLEKDNSDGYNHFYLFINYSFVNIISFTFIILVLFQNPILHLSDHSNILISNFLPIYNTQSQILSKFHSEFEYIDKFTIAY